MRCTLLTANGLFGHSMAVADPVRAEGDPQGRVSKHGRGPTLGASGPEPAARETEAGETDAEQREGRGLGDRRKLGDRERVIYDSNTCKKDEDLKFARTEVVYIKRPQRRIEEKRK